MRILNIQRDNKGRILRAWDRHRIKVSCKKCSKEFETVESRIKEGKGKFCSKECYFANGVSENTRKLQSFIRKGKRVSIKTEFKKGQTAWNKGKNLPNKNKGIPKPEWRGENHWNWKGGQKRYKHLSSTVEYKKWRNDVFTRDDWTCKNCFRKGGYLEAHHIKSWAKFPELRFIVNNGLTLCLPCHQKTDNYKGKNI